MTEPTDRDTPAPAGPTSTTGTGIVVADPAGRILLGRSVGGGRDGQWTLPGGKTEAGETFERTAARELAEEAGITVPEDAVRVFVVLVDTPDDAPAVSRITVGALVSHPVGDEPRLTEPDKFDAWRWFDPDRLPDPLFAPSAQVLAAWRPDTVPDPPPAHRYHLDAAPRSLT